MSDLGFYEGERMDEVPRCAHCGRRTVGMVCPCCDLGEGKPCVACAVAMKNERPPVSPGGQPKEG